MQTATQGRGTDAAASLDEIVSCALCDGRDPKLGQGVVFKLQTMWYTVNVGKAERSHRCG